MPPIVFQVDIDKMIETIVYLANRVPHLTPNRLYAMLYLADKTSLEQYGRFIYGETYYATEQGVVPLHASTFISLMTGEQPDESEFLPHTT